ncbi:MAG: adenylate/guanylate cyclase domain-containing protein [Thermodesulfobacteriota bacterium]
MAFAIAAVIPYLVGVYLFINERIELSEMILFFASVVLFAMLTGFMLIRQSGDQLRLLATETGRIRIGKERDSIHLHADSELNDIAEDFNAVVGKMNDFERDIREQSVQLMSYARDLSRSHQLAKREERLRNSLSRYVSTNLVDKLVEEKGGGLFENEKREVTTLFADIRSFTAMAEQMDAEELVATLNSFFEVMTKIVFSNNGVLDKFVGDQIVAVFGLLPTIKNAEHDAVKTAITMQRATQKMMKAREAKKQMTFGIGVGVNTGRAIVGNVGSRNRMDYTVMGDCVNVSARLQQLAKAGEIIIGQKTYLRTKDRYKANKKIKAKAKNRVQPILCYRINAL